MKKLNFLYNLSRWSIFRKVNEFNVFLYDFVGFIFDRIELNRLEFEVGDSGKLSFFDDVMVSLVIIVLSGERGEFNNLFDSFHDVLFVIGFTDGVEENESSVEVTETGTINDDFNELFNNDTLLFVLFDFSIHPTFDFFDAFVDEKFVSVFHGFSGIDKLVEVSSEWKVS